MTLQIGANSNKKRTPAGGRSVETALAPLVPSEMAVDEMTVLLQEAIAEFQASRRQAEALVRRIRQNEQLVDQIFSCHSEYRR